MSFARFLSLALPHSFGRANNGRARGYRRKYAENHLRLSTNTGLGSSGDTVVVVVKVRGTRVKLLRSICDLDHRLMSEARHENLVVLLEAQDLTDLGRVACIQGGVSDPLVLETLIGFRPLKQVFALHTQHRARDRRSCCRYHSPKR